MRRAVKSQHSRDRRPQTRRVESLLPWLSQVETESKPLVLQSAPHRTAALQPPPHARSALRPPTSSLSALLYRVQRESAQTERTATVPLRSSLRRELPALPRPHCSAPRRRVPLVACWACDRRQKTVRLTSSARLSCSVHLLSRVSSHTPQLPARSTPAERLCTRRLVQRVGTGQASSGRCGRVRAAGQAVWLWGRVADGQRGSRVALSVMPGSSRLPCASEE